MPVQPLSVRQQTLGAALSERTPRQGSDRFSGVLAQAETTSPLLFASATYTIRPGDTLYHIARRLKEVRHLPESPERIVKGLAELNDLADPDLIIAGQQLKFPVPMDPPPPIPESWNLQPPPDTEPPARVDLDPVPPISIEISATFPAGMKTEGPGLATYTSTRQELSEAQPDRTEEIPVTFPAKPVGRDTQPPDSPLPSATMPPGKLATQLAMYKEDQLLAHPGGDYYFLKRATQVYNPAFDRSRFKNRVGKDLADAGENLLNLTRDLAMGSEFKSVGKDGEIRNGQRVGLLGTVKNFFRDLLSGASFGAYVPAGEKAPRGFGASLWHFVRKVFYDAPVKDLLAGVPHAGVNIGKDALFAALNLVQVVPDSTLGNLDWGQKLTTSLFDNGQVAVDYLTDIIPGGDAWLRVHASGSAGKLGLPVLYNLQTTEQGMTDSRWDAVRNTPFRKTVETIGTLLADTAATLTVIGNFPKSSSDQRHP
jgi:LysM repeat protein